MLNNLLQLVKEYAGDAIIKNPAIPNEQNNAAISQVGNSIFDSLKDQIANGNSSDVMELLSGNANAPRQPGDE